MSTSVLSNYRNLLFMHILIIDTGILKLSWKANYL